MYKRQGGKCAICGKEILLTGRKGVHMHIDHCPETKTKKVRGLFCPNCNNKVMHVADKAMGLLMKALQYKSKVRPHRKKSKWDGWWLWNKDRKLYLKDYSIFLKHGVNIEEHERMYSEQGGRCAICGVHKPMRGNGCLHIDHCPETKTNKVRGLLCASCNNKVMYVVDKAMGLLMKALQIKSKSQVYGAESKRARI